MNSTVNLVTAEPRMSASRQSLAAVATLFACACAGAATIELEVDGIASTEGRLMIALFPSAERFRVDSIESRSVPARSGSVSMRFDGLAPGEYAFTVFHDRNGNGVLDANVLGIPIEPAAASGTSRSFGPPEWSKARFALPADGARVSVRLPK